MFGGIVGKILSVNLDSQKVSVDKFPDSYLHKYIGGDGIAARILYDEVPPGVDALDSENRLIISAGPLAGTALQTSCNYSVASKSPITGFTIYNGHSNGKFARLLKYAGFDAIVIKGKAEKPVFLWVNGGKVELKDASNLWGIDTFETGNILKRDLGQSKLSYMCIGPAGENLVLVSGIVNDIYHMAARGGLGAVMGSKKLKAIAVFGAGNVPIDNENHFTMLCREWRKLNVSHAGTKAFSKLGTAALLKGCYQAGDLPIRNWSKGTLDGWENLTGENILEKMFKQNFTCPSCTIAHTKLIELKDGIFSGVCELPEYEMLVAMGSNIGVTDATVVAKGSELLDRYGLDGLGTGNAIAFAMECYEKGLITKRDTGGLELKFGNWEAAFEMVEKMAKRKGFGNILADGTLKTADYIGQDSKKLAVLVKGMSVPMHDHRSAYGYALQYAIGSAGPAHEGGPLGMELGGVLNRFSTEGKAEVVIAGQEFRCFINTLGVCVFGTTGITLDRIANTLNAVTGLNLDEIESRKIARRLINLRRAFNIRHGLTPGDDTLPPRYTHDPPQDGGSKGSTVPIKPMVEDYYRLMGWDLTTGKPYRKTLDDLGLEDLASDLWN